MDESPDVKNLPVAPKGETEFVENFPAFQIGFKTPREFSNELTLGMESAMARNFTPSPPHRP